MANTLTLSFLTLSEVNIIRYASETILGVPLEKLEKNFILETDRYINNLPKYLQKDFKRLLKMFDSKILAVVMIHRYKSFTTMNTKEREIYFKKWLLNRIPIFRTGANALKSLCGWAFYSQEIGQQEMNYLGPTYTREHETPTLLFNKEPWKPTEPKLNTGLLATTDFRGN